MIVTPGSFFLCGLVLVMVSTPFLMTAFHSSTDLSAFSINTVEVVSFVRNNACSDPTGSPALTNFPSSLKYSDPGFTFFALGVILVIVQWPFSESSKFCANAPCRLASNTAVISSRFIQKFFWRIIENTVPLPKSLFCGRSDVSGGELSPNAVSSTKMLISGRGSLRLLSFIFSRA